MNYCNIDSPIGSLRLFSTGSQLVAIEFENQQYDTPSSDAGSDGVLQDAARQLQEYFAGNRKHFELPLSPQGTEFQQQVWHALAQIPYGELRSYSDIANAIGREKAVRAVGAANGRNPLPIIVPCHRVIGSNGKLTGFAGGLDVKKQLLELEGALAS